MEEQELHVCPQCGERQMYSQGQLMKCKNCKAEIPVDIIVMSYELLEKQIAIQALKVFLKPNKGVCVEYNQFPHIVGFNGNDDLVVMEHILKDNQEIGMFVNLVDEEETEEAIVEQQNKK